MLMLGKIFFVHDGMIDNDEQMIFWVGSGVSPQLLQDLFGVDDFLSLDPRMVDPPLDAKTPQP